jgi:hypothetical protein
MEWGRYHYKYKGLLSWKDAIISVDNVSFKVLLVREGAPLRFFYVRVEVFILLGHNSFPFWIEIFLPFLIYMAFSLILSD